MISLEDKAREIISEWESRTGQSVPVSDRSFLWVLAVTIASIAVSTDKKAVRETRENLALTATLSGLTEIGRNYLGREPYAARQCELRLQAIGNATGAVIPAGTSFTSRENNLKYISTETYTGGVSVTFAAISENSGAATTLELWDGGSQIEGVLDIDEPVSGLPDTVYFVVTQIEQPGLDEEGLEEYRTKVLDAIRSQGGGSNLWDYRIWGQEPEGVARVYPYGGDWDENGENFNSFPSTRTVFVQATETIDPDGIAPQDMLDAVYESLRIDPDTNRYRICLGVPDDTLYVRSISRISFDVKINGTDQSWPLDAVDATRKALEDYFLGIKPYIEGLDPIVSRSNVVTLISISDVVQSIAKQYGLNPESVDFNLTGDPASLTKYQISPGKLAKLGSVAFL